MWTSCARQRESLRGDGGAARCPKSPTLPAPARPPSVVLGNGLQVDLRGGAQTLGRGAAILHRQGEHNVAVRELALKQGWSLNEYGLTATGAGSARRARRFCRGERPLRLSGAEGFRWLRENRGEVQAARQHALPALVARRSARRAHGHTTWSDGVASGDGRAGARGYTYWNVSDHSVGLGIVQGVDGEAAPPARRDLPSITVTAPNRDRTSACFKAARSKSWPTGRWVCPTT